MHSAREILGNALKKMTISSERCSENYLAS